MSVCLFVGIESHSPQASVVPLRDPSGGGETHSLAGEGGGHNSDEGTNSGTQMYNPLTRKYIISDP